MKYNKRGLSGVITMVIIILLVLAAIVIVWNAVKPAIEKGSEGINVATACLDVDLEAVSCSETALGGYDTIVKAGTSVEGINAIYLVFEDSTGQTGTTSTNSVPDALETVTISRTLQEIGLSGASKVSVAAEITVDGENHLCEPVAEVECA